MKGLFSMPNVLRESLADIQHQIWIKWMKYLKSCCTVNEDGSWKIPADKAERWQRQIDTDYVDLSEDEKQSDRNQADLVLAAVANSNQSASIALIEAIGDEIQQFGYQIKESGHSFVEYHNLRFSGKTAKEVKKMWNI